MKLVIYGNPIHKARPRFTSRGYAYNTQDQQVLAVKSMMRCNNAFKEPYFDCGTALEVEVTFHMPRAVSRSWLEFDPLKKPDLDNLVKFYLDAANGILWHDDCQVTNLVANKIYSKNPRTEPGSFCLPFIRRPM